ncbi:hypothetical protein RhiirC2_783026 [Rhizophagus irregularis]|uniref:Uncharacterized protein n=1 Tax=Rhizophagus irregularis TaxID=588596 RepID=A0A2N1N1S2_9GLOM|nr:hypothetical protein RhiirC2_783026 [Rhizophagus irregularis]
MLKWKHLCKEKGLNTKGQTPKWFQDLRRCKWSIITWNDIGDYPIFCEDKKKSKSQKHKRIGLHLQLLAEKIDLNNSPYLEKCEGCERNIGKKNNEKKECLIYLENNISRIIERRKENNYIKPYETLNNIIEKNNRVKNVIRMEQRDKIYNEKIEQIDNIIKSEDAFINIIKNSIFEHDNDDLEEKSKYFIIIDVLKTKSRIDAKGMRCYEFNIIWNIVKGKNGNINERKEILLLAKHECTNENEFRIILRSLIIGIIIIEDKSEIILGINENLQKLIKEFRNNFSNRRKIDTKDLRLKTREMLKEKEIAKTIKYSFEIIDEALLVNEFNIYWNQRLINGGYRGWRKKITNAIWKNEILNSNKLDDLFMYNHKKEFDWQTTLEFVSNRIEFSKRQCNNKDTYERSYRIKNLLKDQPTYEILHQRNMNKIDDNKCIRCNKDEVGNWKHIWICDANGSHSFY